MTGTEIIQGDDRLRLFRDLMEDGTLVKMAVSGKDFDSLTVITGIQKKRKKAYFSIDPPKGLEKALVSENQRKIAFEFTSRDRISYSFTCSRWEQARDNILIEIPDMIERKQRRNNFRLQAPPGTKLRFIYNSVVHEMLVSNVSVGGVFGPVVYLENDTEEIPRPKTGEKIKKLELTFPSQEGTLKVNIKEAEVRRVSYDADEGQNCCGIEFTDIRMSEEKSLVECIYRFQRQHLRFKRSA